MGDWGKVAGGVCVLALLALLGCGQIGTAQWASEAEAWLAAMDEAVEQEQHKEAIYYSVDTASDNVMIDRSYRAEGRWDVMRIASGVYGWDMRHGQPYLSATGAVRSDIWMAEEDVGILLMLARMRIGADGIERYTHLAPTWMWWTLSYFQGESIAHAEQIAADYVQAWGTRDPQLIRQLYAAEATLTDDLLGVSAEGPEAIAAMSTASAPILAATNAEVLPQAILDAEPHPDPDAPAAFLHFAPERPQTPTQVVVMVRSEGSCPGASAVALHLDEQQRVTAEQRFRSLASMRSCLDPGFGPQGWWTGRDLPLPFSERITGAIETESGSVEIRNGSDDVEALARWGFDRFAAAGLPAPVVSSITFDPFDDRCESFQGYADWMDGTTAILMCFDCSGIGPPSGSSDADASDSLADADQRTPQQGHLLLHELGHAWLVNHTDTQTREELLAHAGLERWNDRGDQWNQRGVEWAAEALAWGLQGIGQTAMSLGGPDCEALAAAFRILTGAEPLTACRVDATG